MNNNSYVYIPADKLVELIKTACPPNTSTVRSRCLTDEDCLKCWKDWLEDGE